MKIEFIQSVHYVLDKLFIFYRIDNRKEGKEERRKEEREGRTGAELKTRAFLNDHTTDLGRLPPD